MPLLVREIQADDLADERSWHVCHSQARREAGVRRPTAAVASRRVV